MSMAISQMVKLTKVKDASTAATTDVTSDSADLQGYEGCMFFVTLGVITGSAVTSIHAETSSDDSNWNDLEGTNITIADDDDDEFFYLDIQRPRERYLRLIVDRGTQNAILGEIYALRYGAKSLPVTNTVTDAATGEIHISPAEGTI